MNTLKNSFFFKAHTIFIISMLFSFCLKVSARTIFSGPGDTVTYTNAHPAVSTQKSLVQNMSRDQLNSLIDLLMEMDTIPVDLAREIEIASEHFKGLDNNVVAEKSSAAFPSSDLYSSWEINNLFPEADMLKLKGDTSVTLILEGDQRGEYFHPFNGPVTSNFGWRGDSAQHNGIDIDLNKGDKVAAAFDGMVRIAKRCGGFGNVVIIRHYNGLETVYGHLSKIKVKPGQVIVAGQIIGLGGSTGHSTGSHLHFEVRFKGVPINPRYLISFTEQKLLFDDLTIKKTKWGLAAYPTNGKSYTVEKGDTIFEIAKRYATTTASIKEINGLSGRIRLKPGQIINVAQ